MLSCDWLQLSIAKEGQNFQPCAGYTFTLTDKKTINFNQLWEVKKDGRVIAVITCEPRLDWMDKDLMIIKFENEWLYCPNLFNKVNEFLCFNKLSFKGYTRVDIAYDFNRFDCGLHPKEFIRHHLSGAIRKTDKCKIGLHGSNPGAFDIEYIKWGSGNSDISYYLYNKTVELREGKSNKPYIQQGWLQNNIDGSDAWRLEFRIKSQQKVVVDTISGQAKTLKEFGLELLLPENIKLLYAGLYTKYFDFRQANGDSNVTRMPRVDLFTQFRAYGFYLMDKPKGEKRSNRMQKVFIKMLSEDREQLGMIYPDLFREHEKDFLLDLVALKISQNGLTDWAKTRNYIPNEVFENKQT
jgi:hypothetical protein